MIKNRIMTDCRGWVLLMGAALLLGSCSKESLGEPDGAGSGELVEITAGMTLPGNVSADTEAQSKAVVDGSTALTLNFARGDETAAGSYGNYQASALRVDRAAGSGSQILTFAPEQYYLANGLKTRMAGWYPAGTYNATDRTVKWTIDGTQDILASDVRAGSKSAAIGSFAFKHQLAQIQFWPYAESAEVAAQWGPIKSISLAEQPNFCQLTLPASGGTTASFTTSGNNNFSVKNLSSGNLPTVAAKMGDPMMIAPKTSNTALNITIVMTSGTTLAVTVPARSYAAGSVTGIKLKFTTMGAEVEPTIEIADWVDGGDLVDYPKVIDGNTIVVGEGIWAADPTIYPVHDAWEKATPDHDEDDPDANVSGYNTVGRRFRVARTETLDVTSNWADVCNSYSEQGDDKVVKWRLPTIREAALAMNLWADLSAVEGDEPTNRWWTATGCPGLMTNWLVAKLSGNWTCAGMPMIYGIGVRCVGDVDE